MYCDVWFYIAQHLPQRPNAIAAEAVDHLRRAGGATRSLMRLLRLLKKCAKPRPTQATPTIPMLVT